MEYREAREELNKISKRGSVFGLDSIRALMNELGNPQENLRFIHIAGTNGKGSIMAYTRSILMDAGYSVGTYSSPAVFGYLEQFQINGEWMSESDYGKFASQAIAAADSLSARGLAHPTSFEVETAIALLYFEAKVCDYVVLEAGLGGALDSTNVITAPLVCTFASISKDHMGVLGDTVADIARNKSGIIKKGATVVTGPQLDEVTTILKSEADNKNCKFVATDAVNLTESSLEGQQFVYNNRIYKMKLLGRHQIENAACAIEIARALDINETSIYNGIERAEWAGRLELINAGGRQFIFDGAHNEAAAMRLSEALTDYFGDEKLEFVIGIFKDKEYEKVCNLLAPHIGRAHCIDLPDRNRTMPKEELVRVFDKLGVEAYEAADIREAIEASAYIAEGRSNSSESPLECENQQVETVATSNRNCAAATTVITGSLSLLADARRSIAELY